MLAPRDVFGRRCPALNVGAKSYRDVMARGRTYSDEDLASAIAVSTSWRDLLRHLGLAATSSGAMRSVRRHADHLGIDYEHLGNRRPWTEQGLRAAISAASTWAEVHDILGLRNHTTLAPLEGHAARFGIDTAHLSAGSDVKGPDDIPDVSRLARAGPLLAAAWFTLCGNDVSWPLEPCRYDLVVWAREGVRRVQVKTTTVRVGTTWKVYLSTSRHGRTTYGPHEIDAFFIIDGDLNYYVIPVEAVGGLHAIHLAAYSSFIVRTLEHDK